MELFSSHAGNSSACIYSCIAILSPPSSGLLPLSRFRNGCSPAAMADATSRRINHNAVQDSRRRRAPYACFISGLDTVSRQLNFDPLARPYRLLEYLTFGKALEHCRFHFLPALAEADSALVFGDGDGRFLGRLLKTNPYLIADVIDISPAMLDVLYKRLSPEERARVTLHCADARQFTIPEKTYDLVVTHFFLDCLFDPEISALIDRIKLNLEPGALWVVSEFSLPGNRIGALVGKALISSLYLAFRVLTGLQVRTLPDGTTKLKKAGLELSDEYAHLSGLLISQLWRVPSSALKATSPASR
jgi:SAM-dependent methyltransferase